MSRHCAIRPAPIAVMLVLAACGSDDSSPSSTDSSPARFDRGGSRLEVRGYEAAGIFVVDGFYDTKLAFMCVPGIASDGVERCVPRYVFPLGPNADGNDGGPDYAEASCSTPLITSSKLTCADPARVLVRSSTQLGGRERADYWRIGASTQPAMIYPGSFASCFESAPDPAYDYYERGAPLLPTDMVAFVRHDVSVSPALRAVVLDGEDGSRLQTERDFIDVARNEPCEIALAEDGASRCTPLSANVYEDRSFADGSCLKHAAAGPSCSRGLGNCDDSTVSERISDQTANACDPDRHRFYATGPVVATSNMYFGAGPGECSGPTKQPGTILEVGAPIDPTAFPLVVPGSGPVQSRLVEHTLVVGGAPVKELALFDLQLDDECSFEKAADGKVRCLPAHALHAPVGFADAACTTPIFYPPAPCAPSPKYARVAEGSACDPVVRIHTVVTATHSFARKDGACVETSFYPGSFAAGDEVEATTFVEATPSTR